MASRYESSEHLKDLYLTRGRRCREREGVGGDW